MNTIRTWVLTKPFSRTFILLFILNLPLALFRPDIGGSKHDGYLELAQNMARGNGYVFAPGGHAVFHRPPLYATLLAPGTLLPQSCWGIYVVALNSTLLAASATLLLKSVGRFIGEKPAWISWLVFILNPFLLYSIKNPMPPHAQTLVYLLIARMSIDFLLTLLRGESPPGIWLAGYVVALAAGALCHGTMLMNAALWLGVLASAAMLRAGGKALVRVICCGACLAALIIPWTLRNYRATGLFLPVAGNVGVAYFAGNAHWGITAAPEARGESKAQALARHAGLPPDTRLEYYGLTDPRAEETINREFSRHARAHFGAFVKKCFLNGTEYFFPITYFLLMKRGLPVEPLAISVYFALLLGFAARGFWILWRKPKTQITALALALLVAGYAVPYFPFLTFVGHSLYTFGTLPFLAALAAVALTRPPLESQQPDAQTPA